MNLNAKAWKQLFLFAIGLAIAASFCMKWIENDLLFKGQKVSILGLELFYPKEKVAGILGGIDDHIRTLLRYHLSFDFVFMAGIYPAIASLCMMGRARTNSPAAKKFLAVMAFLQLLAWGCDIGENMFLLKWASNSTISDEFKTYHFIVSTKWVLALAGVIVGIIFLFSKRKSTRVENSFLL
jgi:hypothetical protein